MTELRMRRSSEAQGQECRRHAYCERLIPDAMVSSTHACDVFREWSGKDLIEERLGGSEEK